MPKRYPPEFRRKMLDLVASGRRVAQVAADLDISDQTIDAWPRQEFGGIGQMPGRSAPTMPELVAACRRIAELEAEAAVHRRAAELLKEATAQRRYDAEAAELAVKWTDRECDEHGAVRNPRGSVPLGLHRPT
ncbi:transposase [Saccharothrix sp. NRRL B-16348]|uniref:transposase n=1 Tax=Saccharothrix sp. NRRL B-16348 TaxID=1415542 RepID=UPI0007C71908|nr:transposase [Saccharothrix sp. NRRL B-16348]